jgi:CelD/BcsL family acetyltransferase involved in cellulose biosynthesis
MGASRDRLQKTQDRAHVTEPTPTDGPAIPVADAPDAHMGAGEGVGLSLVGGKVDVIVDVEGIHALEPHYEHLYRITGNAVPYARKEWHLAWCEHFLNRNPLIPEHPLFIVVRAISGECVAIVPLVLTRRRVGPLKVTTVALVGADPGLTEIRSPLVKAGYERLTARVVLETLSQVPDWDWIQWDRISDAMAEALNRETTPHWYEVIDDCVVDLPASWQKLRAGLNRNARRSLRHCYNSLRHDGYAFELVVAEDPAQIHGALDRLLELHALRAGVAWGRKRKRDNAFTGPASREFLYDVCTKLAARGTVRIFQLKIGGIIVAAQIGFVVGDSMYLYHSGFDPAWARYGVMTTTVAEAFKYAIAQGLKTVSLSLTPVPAKARWRPRAVRYHSGLVNRKLLRSRIVSTAYRVAISRAGASARMLRGILWPHREWK